MNMVSKLFKDILTGADNTSFDNGRVMCSLSFIVYFTLAVLNTCNGHPWGALDFAGGVSAIAVGFGINLRLKRPTEPKQEVPHAN